MGAPHVRRGERDALETLGFTAWAQRTPRDFIRMVETPRAARQGSLVGLAMIARPHRVRPGARVRHWVAWEQRPIRGGDSPKDADRLFWYDPSGMGIGTEWTYSGGKVSLSTGDLFYPARVGVTGPRWQLTSYFEVRPRGAAPPVDAYES